MAADRILGLERSKRGRNIRAREEVEHGGGWGTHCGRGTHCGQPLEGRGDTAEEAILPLATHSIHKALINRVTLARPGAKHASAWAGPPTHLRRAPVVRRVVQRPRDGCLVRQGRVLALHGGRVLVAIAPVVIASRVSTTH